MSNEELCFTPAVDLAARIGRGQPKSGKDAGSSDNWIIALIGGVMALFIGRAVYTNRKSRRCPACQSNDIDNTPDPEDRRSRKCNNCGHAYLAPAFMGDSGTHGGGGGFGGGSSSGGGASGNF